MTDQTKPARGAVIAALLAVYLIWGSTYLGIRIAIETIPPLLMAGLRNAGAGAILYAWAWQRGAVRPTRLHWKAAFIVGGLMLMGGNGGVTWAEQHVPSGLAALMIAATPLWITLVNWLAFDRERPTGRMAVGLGVGLCGVALLVGPADVAGGDQIDLVGTVALLLAALSWAIGSLYSRRAALPSNPMLATSMEMLGGGILLLLVGTVTGEWGDVDPGAISARSALAFVYLVLAGSLVGFTAYAWLLRHTTPARATSYAYVNPVVAVFLGWALADEPLSARIVLAAAIIIGSVVVITSYRAQQSAARRAPEPEFRPAPERAVGCEAGK